MIRIEHDQLSMCSLCMGRHKVVTCVLLQERRGSDNQRGGHNKVTRVHVVTIGIEHDQLTMNRQSGTTSKTMLVHDSCHQGSRHRHGMTQVTQCGQYQVPDCL